ncbi:MAG: hypothetical protein OEW37_07795 [Rhodospirillaceae bacterium]|nr:hypothetical protein [Rhodospirillaceae bacterium]
MSLKKVFVNSIWRSKNQGYLVQIKSIGFGFILVEIMGVGAELPPTMTTKEIIRDKFININDKAASE